MACSFHFSRIGCWGAWYGGRHAPTSEEYQTDEEGSWMVSTREKIIISKYLAVATQEAAD